MAIKRRKYLESIANAAANLHTLGRVMSRRTQAAAVLSGVLCVGLGAVRGSATTISDYDKLTDQRAKSTFLARVITTVTTTLVKELSSPLDANGRSKTRATIARDNARAALVPKAVTGTLGADASTDRIGLLAVQIAVARNQNPATHLETVVRKWILDELDAFDATRSTGARTRSP